MPQFEGQKLVLATHNADKLEEIRTLLADYPVEVVSAGDLELPVPEGSDTSFAGNARLKAHAAAQATGLPALADDSGLEVEALRGAPGVYTADWAAAPEGYDFDMAMQKIWNRLEAISADFPRRARFCSTLVMAWPDGTDEIFTGTVEGQIVWPKRGGNGHGCDPIFRPDGYSETFGEMDPEDKNEISHRTAACLKLIESQFSCASKFTPRRLLDPGLWMGILK